MTSPLKPPDHPPEWLAEIQQSLVRWESHQSPPLILAIIVGALFYAAPIIGYLLVDSLPSIPFTMPGRRGGTTHLNFNLVAFPIAGLLFGMAASLVCSIYKRLADASAAYKALGKILNVSRFVIPIVGLGIIGYIVLNQVLGHPTFGIIPSQGVRSVQQILFDCIGGLFLGFLMVPFVGFLLMIFCWLPFWLGIAAIAAVFGDFNDF